MNQYDDAKLLCEALGLQDGHASLVREGLEEVGGLRGLWIAGPEALGDALTDRRAQRLERLLQLASRLVEPRVLPERIECSEDVAAYFRPRLATCPTETFWVLMMDARGRPVGHACIAVGTLTACLVHPREVFGPAIRARAAQIILVHNHPSGDPTPSDDDVTLTERMTEAGDLLGIPVVDHVVVGLNGFRSIGAV